MLLFSHAVFRQRYKYLLSILQQAILISAFALRQVGHSLFSAFISLAPAVSLLLLSIVRPNCFTLPIVTIEKKL